MKTKAIVSQLSKCLKFVTFRGVTLYRIQLFLSPQIDSNFSHLLSCDTIVIVLTFHIECFFFSLPLSPPFIINDPETVNCCNFLFVSTFVGDFGRELSCTRAARL